MRIQLGAKWLLALSLLFLAATACNEAEAPSVQVESPEEKEDRANHLQRAIRFEDRLIEKFGLQRPMAVDADGVKALEIAYGELNAQELLQSFDLEFGVARVSYDKWTELGKQRKVGVVSLLSEYRYAKVGAQFVSVRRETGPAEIAAAGIDGIEIFR